jgi:predicted nuclease of predicted toxin-antitoxin system
LKFLADMGVADETVSALRRIGHDVVHARDVGLRSESDAEVLRVARAEGRAVLTFDLDFGDLLAGGGESLPSVILVRTQNQRASVVTPRILDVVDRFAQDLQSGALIVVEDARFRLRRLPFV